MRYFTQEKLEMADHKCSDVALYQNDILSERQGLNELNRVYDLNKKFLPSRCPEGHELKMAKILGYRPSCEKCGPCDNFSKYYLWCKKCKYEICLNCALLKFG